MITGHATPAGKTVFVFPGQGSQWIGMGVELLDTAPVFAEQMNACAEAFAEFVDWSLIDVLRGAPGAPSLDRVDVVQPALFAVMVSLAELWRSIGVRPDAVIGHSQGEIAAAYVAGACRCATPHAWSPCAASCCWRCPAAAAWSRWPAAPTTRENCWRRTAIGSASPRSTGDRPSCVSGEVAALDELVAQCTEREIRARRIDVDYASHSVAVDAIREQLAEALSGIEPQSTRTVFFSTVTGGVVDTADLDADYWYRNIRQTVEFDSGGAHRIGKRLPDIHRVQPAPRADRGHRGHRRPTAGADAVVVPTLGRDDGGLRRFLSSAAQAFVSGVKVDWRAACRVPASSSCRRMPLSDGASGCPVTAPRSTPPASAWAPASTRCSAPSSNCRTRAGWC